MTLIGKHYLIVGGSSGMGRATAALALARGATVEIVGRNRAKLHAASEALGEADRLSASTLDMTDEVAVRDFFAVRPKASVDALIISASSAAHGAFANAQASDIRAMIESKFLGPYVVAREALPAMRDGGSITFFSGVLSRRPSLNAAGLAAVNAAVEALGRALALELAPRLRVNTVSPGMTDTKAYAGMTPKARTAMFASVAKALPLARVGAPEDIAEATLFLAASPFTTGHTLDIDGGHLIA